MFTNRPASDAVRIIEQIHPELSGQVIPVENKNSLLLKGDHDSHEEFEKLLKTLDKE